MAQRIRAGDTVAVIAGKDKGKRGEVMRVDLQKNRVLVAGVNTVVRHISQRRGTRQTGRITSESSISLSNVMLVDSETNRAGRVGWRFLVDGTKVRYIKGE